MDKHFKLNIGDYLLEKITKPIRGKDDIILILLETIKIFLVGELITENPGKGEVIIKIDKMSRIFFSIKNKYFSFCFPFSIEKDSTGYKIYDSESSINLDLKMVSIMISMFENNLLTKDSIYDFYEQFVDDISVENGSNVVEYENFIWIIIKKIIFFESGYIRYDYDPIYENGLLHPLNHLDICYSTKNTFKVGLNDKISMDYFIDFLNIKTECKFLKK